MPQSPAACPRSPKPWSATAPPCTRAHSAASSPARRQVIECARQGTVWANSPGASFFDNLIPDGESLPASLLADLQTAAASAARAYAATARWLADVYLPRAEPRDFVGPERYERAARGFLGERIDLHDTYQWGWEEVWRIGDQMLAAAEQIAPGQGIAGAIAQLEADDARAIDGEDAFRDWMQRTQDETMRQLNGEHFDIPEPVRQIEAMIAPPGGALAMYYTGPHRRLLPPRPHPGTRPAAPPGSPSGVNSASATTKACPATTSKSAPPAGSASASPDSSACSPAPPATSKAGLSTPNA